MFFTFLGQNGALAWAPCIRCTPFDSRRRKSVRSDGQFLAKIDLTLLTIKPRGVASHKKVLPIINFCYQTGHVLAKIESF